jgi:holliday junction DNA helicase RuvA
MLWLLPFAILSEVVSTSGSPIDVNMIATIEGILEYAGVDSITVKIGGIGIQVHVPASSPSRFGGKGSHVSLYTHLQIREDTIFLYGFTSSEELDLFKNLISVSGIGPKTALSLLSSLSVEQLTMAITSGNAELISQVPGIGKKAAGRIIIELRGKLEREWPETGLSLAPEDADAIAALTNLGYSLMEATHAISRVPNAAGLSLEEKVKTALQQITRS